MRARLRRYWQRFKSFVKRTKEKVSKFRREKLTKRNIWQVIYFTGSIALCLLVTSLFLPQWLTAVIVTTVVVHEMGHYITARSYGRNAWLPVFIPLVYGIIGGTYVPGVVPDQDIRIALAGPTAGIAFAGGCLLIALLMAYSPLAWASGWLIVFQLYSGTLGSDGRKMRRARLVDKEDLTPADILAAT